MKTLELNKSLKYLLACSYGPDSMALFYLLEKQGYDFEVAIVNYHLRTESDIECIALEDYCRKHDKVVHILDVSEPPKSNIEEECRKIRYEYFSMLCKNSDMDGVVVAHHQDDLIETYLMQKGRNNCPTHYGMKKVTNIFGVEVYRPLLDYTKTELMEICKKYNVPYMIDRSNLTDDFLRNRIRHSVVSKMDKKHRDDILKEIDRENEQLSRLFASINLGKLKDVSYLSALENKSFQYAVNMLLNMAGNYPPIGAKKTEEIRKILLSRKPNVTAKITKEVNFVKEYDKCYFAKDEEFDSYSYVLDKPTILDTPYFYLDFSKGKNNKNIKRSDYPITIRNIRDNDTYFISDYMVSLKRLMIDWKVPTSVRKIWPVFVSKDGVIIYVPRYQKDFVIDKDSKFYVKIK